MIRSLLAVALAAMLAVPLRAEPADPGVAAIAAAERHTVPLTIRTARGPERYQVERALTSDQQELGLMYRRHMGARHGMIFPMEPARPASFWMKNTFIPLDLVFIAPDHTISSIAPNATPLSTATIDSTGLVIAVLELNGGVAARDHLHPGDRVRW